MRYLITGGCGFIGSHLADALLKDGHDVCVIDDLSTGRASNIAQCKTSPHFRYVIDTCANRGLMAELVDDADVVYHLAAAVGVELIVKRPIETIEKNIHLTQVVLELAAKKKKPIFIASTSECYGKSVDLPFNEDGDLTFGPSNRSRWSYAASKLVDEFLAIAYWKERQVPTVVGRLFNTVGPRQTGQYGMVVPRLVGQAVRGEPLTVYGDGTQTRCFTHVYDVVDALVKLPLVPRAYGEVVNIGNTFEISIRELAEKIVECTASKSELHFIPYEKAYEPGFEDMRRRAPNTKKIHDLIGWRPVRDLDDILLAVIGEQMRRAADAANSAARHWA